MAQANQLTSPLLSSVVKNSYEINKDALAARIRTALAIISTAVLMALLLRVMLALFLVEGAHVNLIHAFTEPFVAPFNSFFPKPVEMIQVSSMIAFSTYYLAVMAAAKLLALQQPRATSS